MSRTPRHRIFLIAWKGSFHTSPERISIPLPAGLVANKTAANEDNLGTGPAERVRFGLRVAYPKQALIDWLKKKVKDV